jgi:uncharacterized caspase-like protein
MASSIAPALCAEGAKRQALVIGNSAYKNISTLINPVNDATDIAAKLKTLQFDVLLATDADRLKMAAILEEFRKRVTPAHVALVFYAGHGVTVSKESFLLPVDVPATIEVDDKGQLGADTLNRQLVSMASVLSALEASKIGIVFLDACRTSSANPGEGLSLRVVSLGTKRAVPILRGAGSSEVTPSPYSAGVFRGYATQLDNVASDGDGRNSPFTKALLRHIGTRGITIQDLMIRVRKAVMEETANQQVPWEEAALNESFYFVPPATTSSSPVVTGPAKKSGGGGALPTNLGVGIGSGL